MAAAVTPSSIQRLSAGSNTLAACTFANTTDDADYWASGMKEVVGYWATGTDDPTQTKEKVDVGYSAGTFTFYLGEDNRSFILYVLYKG